MAGGRFYFTADYLNVRASFSEVNAADPELIQDVIVLTGCSAPAWLESDAPVLQIAEPATVYIIGVIGVSGVFGVPRG